MKQIELEKLKVNVGNTKDQVINNQEKVIKCLKVSLDQEKEEALLKNKEQNEGFLNFQMSLIYLTQVFVWVTHYAMPMQYLSWPLTFLLVVEEFVISIIK